MNKRIIAVLTVGISIVVLLGILFVKKEIRKPIIFAEESGSYPEKSLDDLIYEEDAIVIGKFNTALPSKWNTPNGKLPNNATVQTVYDQRLYIYTEYIFQVEEFLKGESPTSSIIIRTFGGQVGLDVMTVSSHEIYEIGQTYLLFLHYDPRLAIGEDPGPFLIFHPATYLVSNGRATSRQGEWDEKELRDYIINSPFDAIKSNIPNTPEVKEIMQKVKMAADLEKEAKSSFDPTEFSEVFINDPRFPLNTDALDFVRNVTDDQSLETAGLLDYKIAQYTNWKIPQDGATPLESIWISFVSINVNDDLATVIIEPGHRGRSELTLVRNDGNWYITGTRGITEYENNTLPSVLAPDIPKTPEVKEVVRRVETAYDIEAEAIHTLDTSKLSDIFVNDPKYPINSKSLEFVKIATKNPGLETAGYLEYKLAYINGWETTPAWSKSPNRELILYFSDVNIEGDYATVYIENGFSTLALYMVRVGEKWYIAGEKGI